MSRTYWLSTWLEELAAATTRLRGVTRDELLAETGDVEGWAVLDDGRWRFERNGASEVWRILDALAHGPFAIEGGVRWLHAFDWKDSDAWAEIGPMVGVADEELTTELGRLGDLARAHARSVEVDDYVDLCNAHSRNGTALYSVDTHGDSYLYVALTPAACAAAVARGLLLIAPGYGRTPLLDLSANHTISRPSAAPPLALVGLAFACLMAAGAIVYAVVALARSGSSLGSLAVVIALVVGFELAKSAALRRVEVALGGRHPTLMRVLRFLTRT